MTLDLKAVEALSELMAIAEEASRVYNENGCRNGVVPAGDANYEFMGAMANAAPELLALAKEALLARKWLWDIQNWEEFQGPNFEAYRVLVSQHQSGGA